MTAEQIDQAVAAGDEVIVKGYRGAFGGIVQYLALRRGWLGTRDEVMRAETQVALARHYAGPPLLDTETEQSAVYWRAVNP